VEKEIIWKRLGSALFNCGSGGLQVPYGESHRPEDFE